MRSTRCSAPSRTRRNSRKNARQYANTLLGNARGQAAKIREDAAAYKNQVVQEATGEAARFVSVYNEYVKAPEVTRRRLYLETMEQVLGNSNKVVVEPGAPAPAACCPTCRCRSSSRRPAPPPDNSSSTAPQGASVTAGGDG